MGIEKKSKGIFLLQENMEDTIRKNQKKSNLDLSKNHEYTYL